MFSAEQIGAEAGQSVSLKHSTQTPPALSHTGDSVEQLLLVTHSTHVCEEVLQYGVVPEQFESEVHCTQVWLPVSQTRPGPQ